MIDALSAIQAAIREGRYEMTLHALDEAAQDDLHVVDVESAVLTGTIAATQSESGRSPKYVIEGLANDLTIRVGVVARFHGTDALVMITVYEIKP